MELFAGIFIVLVVLHLIGGIDMSDFENRGTL